MPPLDRPPSFSLAALPRARPLPYPPPAPASLLSSSVLLIGKHMCLCLFFNSLLFLTVRPIALLLLASLPLPRPPPRPPPTSASHPPHPGGGRRARAREDATRARREFRSRRRRRAPASDRRRPRGGVARARGSGGAFRSGGAERSDAPARATRAAFGRTTRPPRSLPSTRPRCVWFGLGSGWFGSGLCINCNDFLDLFSYPFLCFFYFKGAGSAGPLKKGSLFLPITPNLLSYPASRVIRRPPPRNPTAGFWS